MDAYIILFENHNLSPQIFYLSANSAIRTLPLKLKREIYITFFQ